MNARIAARAIVALAAMFAFGAALPSQAAPRYEGIVLSDKKDGGSMGTFKPGTPKLFLRAKLADVPSGSKVSAVWVAEKTAVGPPNYKIDTSELSGGGMLNEVTFSTNPTKGWPLGKYRVDLFINGKPAGNVPFSIEK